VCRGDFSPYTFLQSKIIIMSARDYLKNKLEKEGYTDLRYIDGVGFCGLRDFAFTIGLCYGLEEWGYLGRYCYPKEFRDDAQKGLQIWGGKVGIDPVGKWVKHKGVDGEWTNPNCEYIQSIGIDKKKGRKK
jgi:hypothetical protein